MKNLNTLLLAILCTACNSQNNKNSDKMDYIVVGNDKDSHNCISSAGYTWSVIKNECIRVWEEGTHLELVDSNATYQTIATIILANDKEKAELFISTEENSIIMEKYKEQPLSYKNDIYKLEYINNKWNLTQKNKLIYISKP